MTDFTCQISSTMIQGVVKNQTSASACTEIQDHHIFFISIFIIGTVWIVHIIFFCYDRGIGIIINVKIDTFLLKEI